MLLILPFCYCYFLFNADIFVELLWFCFTVKVAGGHVHDSRGKSPPPALSDSPAGCQKLIVINHCYQH